MTNVEYAVYRKVQKEFDMDDIEAVYSEAWREGLPEELPKETVEKIADVFRDNHDWTNADYDALSSLVMDVIDKMKGVSENDS